MVRQVVGAVALGFGMVFAHRVHDEHWSTPPTVVIEDADASDAGQVRR